MSSLLTFEHVFTAGTQPSAPTLLLLHGTGGNEHDLLPLGRLLPGAHVLSPRGQVLENGMPRFFRRLAEGVFDIEDLKRRAGDLAAFVQAAADEYRFDRTTVVALGYSNGANIASAVMLLHPGTLAGGVLLRAMVPLEPQPLPVITGTRVCISNGEEDPMAPAAETQRLARLLQRAGADVEVHWQPTGHQLMPGDFAVAKTWLQSWRSI